MIDKLIPQLTEAQLKAATKLSSNEEKRGIVWWKIGEGKTRIAIAWMFMLFDKPKPLIVCSPQAYRQWLDEIELLGLNGNVKPKFLSYGILSKSNKKGSVTILDDNFNCVVVDEGWLYKNPKSNRSTSIRRLTRKRPSIGLSGSMMTAGNIEDLYGQAKAMCLDDKLASSMTNFRSQFCIEIKNWAGFLDRFPRKGSVEAIQRRLIDNVDVYFPKDVREIRDIPVSVNPTSEQLEVRKELLKTYSYEEDNISLEIKNAASMLVKLQQVSDGFLRDGQGNYLPIKSNKMLRLKELCTELLDSGERILIWVGFKRTASILSEVLPCKTTILSGDGKFDIYGWRDGKVRATIATVGSGASLNDFANIRYSIFYSTSFSNLHLQQARGRTNRKSSLHNCSYYYFLSTDKFPDKQIYEMIEENRNKEEIVKSISERILEEG